MRKILAGLLAAGMALGGIAAVPGTGSAAPKPDSPSALPRQLTDYVDPFIGTANGAPGRVP